MKKTLISSKVQTALNGLAALEQYNSVLYQAAASACQYLGYFGAQKRMLKEAGEEVAHYQHVVDFANDGGFRIKPETIEAPEVATTSLMDILKAAYDQEVYTEKQYLALAKMTCDDDYVTYEFALGVLKHQRKSVGEFGDLIARLETVGDDRCGILIIDQELGNVD